MPDEHALIGPSSAKQWIACTPSIRFGLTFPPKEESSFAKEGTLAHEIAEVKVKKWLGQLKIGAKSWEDMCNKWKKDPRYTPEVMEMTDIYLDYFKQCYNGCHSMPMVIVEERVDLSHFIPNSFGTLDLGIVADGVLHIIDFKYGKGILVSAYKNPQLRIYGKGLLDSLSGLFDIHTVKYSIVQPRIVSEVIPYEEPVEKLNSFINTVVIPAAQKAYSGEGEFNPGEHCVFCNGYTKCKAKAESIVEPTMKFDFSSNTLTREQQSILWRTTAEFESWRNKLKKELLEACLDGEDVPGLKAVEGKAYRNFKDLDNLDTLLLETFPMLTQKELYPKRASVADIERIVGATLFKKKASELLDIPKGAPTLVEESNKKPAISRLTLAADDFKDL